MKATFFPFTRITDKIVDAIGGCLRPIVIYQPSRLLPFKAAQKWVSDGLIELRFPVSGDEATLEAIVKNFHSWGEYHHKGMDLKAVYKKSSPRMAPFFDENSVSKIRFDIKSHARNPKLEKETDRLSAARVFLHMAQEYDTRLQEVKCDLEQLDTMERRFKNELHGNTSEFIPKGKEGTVTLKEDPGSYMTTQRIDAWADLFLNDERHHTQGAPELLVTSSRSVWDDLVENVSDQKEAIRFDRIPARQVQNEAVGEWRNRFNLYLEALVSEKGAAVQAPPDHPFDYDHDAALTILKVQNTDALDFFARPPRPKRPQHSILSGASRPKNLLIGLVEI